MARIPDDVIESIRQAVDLADLIGRYVPLKKAGKSWKGCCPFHQEKTPSFNVTPEKGMWKCFGCGKGGNAFTFLMEREGLSFPEAARQLAREVGIRLPEDDDPAASAQASRLARLRDVCEWACRFFEVALRSPEGEVARSYFKRRGITGESAKRFRLGFAPSAARQLIEAARGADIKESELVEAGLVRRKEAEDGRPAWTGAMFRGRVTFPICDTQGRVIAFGARTLGDDQPKYLNSPETPLFTKGRNVYALHLAKEAMMKPPFEGAVMEGYTDVIMAHQSGWPVAVAGLGTALTREQASLIAKYVKRLYLVYDGDAAGVKAADKNAPAFLPEEIDVRVALLPDGLDPCDLLVDRGLPALTECLARSREVFDHLLDTARRVPGEAQALDAALLPLAGVTGTSRRAIYVKRVAETFLISDGQVLDRLRELHAKTPPTAVGAGPPPRAWPSGVAEAPPSVAAAPPVGRPSSIEEQLVEALLGRPELCVELAERLPVAAVVHPYCRALVDLVLARFEESGTPPSVESVMGALEEPAVASFAAGLRSRGVGKDLAKQGRDCIERLVSMHEAQTLRPALDAIVDPAAQGRPLDAEEGEALRRWLEFHQRVDLGRRKPA